MKDWRLAEGNEKDEDKEEKMGVRGKAWKRNSQTNQIEILCATVATVIILLAM